MNVAPLDASPGNQRGVAIGPVVAAIGTVAVARCRDAFLRAAAELADRNHQRLREHPALIEVANEPGKTRVEHRA